ncbi:hypothetical protein [Dictyobacter arantiisoli]|uniref:Uncharacterized protein n=1 Tax=Dictyobacter arantiisoli TaxID=2014874 RepID=A0A5A5T8N1_9CHLR|nr:hypothetical protein [Dictyobacter arantiisoli]GCF07526.1 hypothetical protein KDI_10900 [Dictyobacter arantiisoli]
MDPLSTGPSWTYSSGFNAAIDFCIWILEIDGIHIPPFDLHPEGNGSLRAKGLDTNNWRAWFARVVTSQDQRQSPATLWMSGSEMREALEKLWEAYLLLSDQRGSWDEKIGMKQNTVWPNLWNDLKPYHTSLDALTIHLVNYSKEMVEVFPPTSVVLSIVNGDISTESFTAYTLDAARKLASQFPSHRPKSINTAGQEVSQNQERMNSPRLSVQNQEAVFKEFRSLQPGDTKKCKISRFLDPFVILDIDGMEMAAIPEGIEHQPDKELEVGQEVEIRVLPRSTQDQIAMAFKIIEGN